jgi:hypothetical protein
MSRSRKIAPAPASANSAAETSLPCHAAALDIAKTVEYSGLSKPTLYRLFADPDCLIQTILVGRRRLVLRESIDVFLASKVGKFKSAQNAPINRHVSRRNKLGSRTVISCAKIDGLLAR